MVKEINLKDLNKEQKAVVKHINNMIMEHQQVFQEQPEELLISSKDFKVLEPDTQLDYLLLGKVKIYKI